MFERYTDKARRVVFFARYEASQLGSSFIGPEHLLLGLLREDKRLAIHFLKTNAAIESIRGLLDRDPGPAISTSVDLPLSHEAKRVLAYGAEESERLNDGRIGTPHLFLGLLREPDSFAAKLLAGHGVSVETCRRDLAAFLVDVEARVPATRMKLPGSLLSLFSDLEDIAEITVAEGVEMPGCFVDIAVYRGRGVPTDGNPLTETEEVEPSTPAGTVADLRRRIRSIVRKMEAAIGQHQFEAARNLSEEERRVRRELLQSLDRVKLESPSGDSLDQVPFLCILLVENEGIVTLSARIEALLERGVTHVWMLHQAEKRIYTATPAEGLREFKGQILRIEDPNLEIERSRLFD